jgi:hypothetical protein
MFSWAPERLGLRKRIERLFGYLKERTIVLHYRLRARDHAGNQKLTPFSNLITLYYKP